MPPPPPYLSVDTLTAQRADKCAFGSLAFYPDEPGGWILFVEDVDGRRAFVELTGSTPLTLWTGENLTKDVLVVADWRLEVEPTSFHDRERGRTPELYAFISAGGCGVIAKRPPRYVSAAIDFAGKVLHADDLISKGLFSDWRIVTGAKNDPTLLIESSKLSVASED